MNSVHALLLIGNTEKSVVKDTKSRYTLYHRNMHISSAIIICYNELHMRIYYLATVKNTKNSIKYI